MALTRREKRHQQTRQEIKQIARQQMAQQGTAALSLRGIAAEMGMSAPSLYNYYSSRDDLVTDLLVESYTHQAEALEQASASCAAQEAIPCLLSTVLTYRQWAVEHPTEFALIAGNPIPGYVAPVEQTLPLGRRSTKVFLDLLQRAWDEHLLHPQSGVPELAEATFNDEFMTWCHENRYALPVIKRFLELYAFIQGTIALEVFGHLPFFLNDPVAFYRSAVLAMIRPDKSV
ncbi:MAG TPA: TetR/AcrR family transcriptional regulator [Ktedonobacteraceae bacterium]|nr:TetR/AcrR family transcriptional regulator [Ktedonobacteraceae bacterium]